MFLRILVCTTPYLFAVLVSSGVNHIVAKQPASTVMEAERHELSLRLREAEISADLLGREE